MKSQRRRLPYLLRDEEPPSKTKRGGTKAARTDQFFAARFLRKLVSAQVCPVLLASSSQFLTGTSWRSQMFSTALLLSSLNWPQGWSSYVCRMPRRQLTEPPWHRRWRTWTRECEARRPFTGDGPSVLSTAEPVAHPQDWTVTAAEEHDAPITECAAMITRLAGQSGAGHGCNAYPLWYVIPSSQATHRKPGAGGPEAQDPYCMGGERCDVPADRSGEANSGAERLPRLDDARPRIH